MLQVMNIIQKGKLKLCNIELRFLLNIISVIHLSKCFRFQPAWCFILDKCSFTSITCTDRGIHPTNIQYMTSDVNVYIDMLLKLVC
jgi:hypothetical protein